MEAQATDIASTRKADWVVGSLFGGAAAASVRELHRGGFPANRFLSFVYGAVEADVEAAGWDVAQGYLGLQFTALGRDSTVQDIVKMFRDDGKEVPKYVGGAYYNRWRDDGCTSRRRRAYRNPRFRSPAAVAASVPL
jgi:branched-chain amino acid transport system substrate-binding protein